MNEPLPDVSLTDIAPSLSPLAWVGMQGIDPPITVAESGYQRDLHARADVQVDLLNHIYFETRSFSSWGSSWVLTQSRSATAYGVALICC